MRVGAAASPKTRCGRSRREKTSIGRAVVEAHAVAPRGAAKRPRDAVGGVGVASREPLAAWLVVGLDLVVEDGVEAAVRVDVD